MCIQFLALQGCECGFVGCEDAVCRSSAGQLWMQTVRGMGAGGRGLLPGDGLSNSVQLF